MAEDSRFDFWTFDEVRMWQPHERCREAVGMFIAKLPATFPYNGPILDGYKRSLATDVRKILYCMSQGLSHLVTVRETKLAASTVSRWLRKLEQCALWFTENQFAKPERGESLVVDETCFASRKYHRGHRALRGRMVVQLRCSA